MVEIHFLNVGHGDCTVVKHASGRLTMIDINNGTDLDSKSQKELSDAFGVKQPNPFLWHPPVNPFLAPLPSLRRPTTLREAGYDIEITNPITFLKTRYPRTDIFRYIQTHPDLDHMRGLAALRTAGIQIVNLWDTEHDKIPDFQSECDEEEWNVYEALRSSDSMPKVLLLYRGASGVYYNEEPFGVNGGDGLEILYPTVELAREANEADNTNNLSYVVRFRYKGISVIFGGDAEEDAWEAIAQQYGEELKCHVLKASHHGRDSGYHQEAVELMSPEYTIVSVGKKPDTDATNKYRQYSDNVWSTRWRGNISLTISEDGRGTITSEQDR